MKAEAETKFSFELPGVDNCKVFGAWDRVEQVSTHGYSMGTAAAPPARPDPPSTRGR